MELFRKLQTRWKTSARASEREDLRGLCISFLNSPNVTQFTASGVGKITLRLACCDVDTYSH